MSPPVRSKYVTSPPPRANSTPPANHHLNNAHQRQIEDYEYTQLLMGMNQMNMAEKVSRKKNQFFFKALELTFFLL
jgi:hypothetical protein